MSQVECRLSLGFDTIEFELSGRNHGLTPTSSRIAFHAGNVEAAAQALDAAAKQLATAGMKRVGVQVAGRWLHWLNLPWSAALLKRTGSQEACRQQLQLNHGEAVPLVFAQAAAPYGRERVAVGLPEALLTALQKLAGPAALSVTPATTSSLPVLPTEISAHPYGLFVCEAGVVTCFLVRNGTLCRAYPQAMPVGGVAGLSAVWQRLRLRDEALAACEWAYVLDLAAKKEGVQEALPAPLQYVPLRDIQLKRESSPKMALNFLPQAQPWKGWRGAAAAAGLLLMIATGWQWWVVQQVLNEAQERLAAMSVSVDGARVMPVRVTTKNSRDLQVQIKGVNEAVRQLSAPVGLILQSLKPAPASGIALLQLHFKAGQARQLSIEGIAPKAETMTAYVTALGAKPVFASAWLAHHELVGEDLSGGYRFTIEASWQE